LDELVPAQKLEQLTFGEVIAYRKESESAREAFLEHLITLQAKVGSVPSDGDYQKTIERIVTTEIRPAARTFQNKLDTIYEKLKGKIVGGTLTWAGSSAAIQIFGGITWERVLLGAIAAGAYVTAQAVDALVDAQAASRDSAVSYLLDLEK
jgi:hypothetical protein